MVRDVCDDSQREDVYSNKRDLMVIFIPFYDSVEGCCNHVLKLATRSNASQQSPHTTPVPLVKGWPAVYVYIYIYIYIYISVVNVTILLVLFLPVSKQWVWYHSQGP